MTRVLPISLPQLTGALLRPLETTLDGKGQIRVNRRPFLCANGIAVQRRLAAHHVLGRVAQAPTASAMP